MISWCGPCKSLSPIIDEISAEHSEIKVCKVNIQSTLFFVQPKGAVAKWNSFCYSSFLYLRFNLSDKSPYTGVAKPKPPVTRTTDLQSKSESIKSHDDSGEMFTSEMKAQFVNNSRSEK